MKVDRRSGRKSGQRPTGMTRRGVAEDGAAFGTPVLPGTIDALAQAVGRDERGSRKRVIPTEGSVQALALFEVPLSGQQAFRIFPRRDCLQKKLPRCTRDDHCILSAAAIIGVDYLLLPTLSRPV